MVDETTIDVSATDSGSAVSTDTADSSSVQGATSPQQGTSSADVSTQSPDQTQAQEQIDPLKDVPTAAQAAELQTVSKEAFLSLRNEYDRVKPQIGELTTKLQPFESVADRFQTPEEVSNIVQLSDSLYKYSPDPETKALVPDPSEFVAHITETDPIRADHLAGQLIWGMTKDPVTGQPVQRAEILLHNIKADPASRAKALQILGAVDPGEVQAPTWAPSQEELEVIKPELQDFYRKLPYDKRESLKLNDPDFINEYLDDQKFKAETRERTAQDEVRQRQYFAQQEQQAEQAAVSAGDAYVETGFKEGFTNFAKHIYETYKPTDNDTVNRTEGAQVALAVVALSHPDTRFAAEQALKDMGLDPSDLEAFNHARERFAESGRQHGYLTHKKMRTIGDPARDQQRLIALAKGLATKITKAKDAGFVLRATARNQTLDQAATARPPIGGSPHTAGNGTGNKYLQAGKRSSEEIWGN